MSDNGKKKSIDLKILHIGDSNVGKTTLLLKYLKGEFIMNLDITWRGVNLFRKMIEINRPSDELINYFINIWDIAGSDYYLDFFSLITEPMNAIIIQVNAGKADDIEYSVSKWIKIIENFVSSDFLKFLLIIDKENEKIIDHEMYNLIQKFKIAKFFLIDAKNTDQVNKAFEQIFDSIIAQNQ